MAIFNPSPQPMQAPDWTNVTKPIEQPKADISSGLMLDTVGKGIDGAVTIADTAVKEDIKSQADTGVDKLRDETTSQLLAIRNTQIAQQQGQSGQQSLLPNDGTGTPPPNLQAGLDRINTLGVAMSQNGGKSNDTLYTGALNAQAKQLRAQYPGYRDYIDEQIKSVSGVDPANAFMKNLMEDINKNQENSKTQLNANLTTLRDQAATGFHDTSGVTAAQVYDMVQKQIIPPEKGLLWLNSAKKLEYDTKQKADARASRQGDDADDAVQAQKDFSNTITSTLNHNWNTMTIGKGTDTFKGMSDFLQANSGNSSAMTDEQAQAMGQQMQALRTRTAQGLMAQAASDGTLQRMGGDATKVKAQIDARLAPMDLAVQDVYNKDWGSAYSHMNFNKAIGADTGNIMNNAPDEAVRNYVRGSQWISQNGGTEFAKEFQQRMLLGPVPSTEKAWYQGIRTSLLSQPGQAQGKLTSINGAIASGQAAGVTSPKTYSELISSVDDLANPKLGKDAKLNLATAFFDPTANAGLLSDKNFTMDHYDATLQRNVPGKLSVFTKLTSPAIAQSIAKLGETNPDVVKNYQTMLSREFGEQLFSRELIDLRDSNLSFTPNSPYKIKFSNDDGSSPHFEVVGPHGEPMTMTQANAMRAPVGQINRLNTGMAGLFTAFKGSGSADPMHDVMTTINRYNFQDARDVNNSPKGYESLTGLPKALWDSLMSAQMQRLNSVRNRQSEPATGSNY